MSNIERMTITLPSEMANSIKAVVAAGGYASSSEVVREALRDWQAKHEAQLRKLAALQRDIDKGLADRDAGRVKNFDSDQIIKRGKKLLAKRSPSA